MVLRSISRFFCCVFPRDGVVEPTGDDRVSTNLVRASTETNVTVRIDHSTRVEYDIGQQIGQGGFGTVFAAIRRSDAFPVAIKWCDSNTLHKRQWMKIGENNIPLEIVLLTDCQACAGVIEMYEWRKQFESDSFLIIMERPLNCVDFFQFVFVRGRLPEHMSQFFFRQIMNSIIELGKQNIVHGDIKTENFILDLNTAILKLIDFGSGFYDTGDIKFDYDDGTPKFLPPEFSLSHSFWPVESTVWSLGILLFDMKCGYFPFEDIVETIAANPTYPADIPEDCKMLMKQCLSYNATDRPTYHEILEHEWTTKYIADKNDVIDSIINKKVDYTVFHR